MAKGTMPTQLELDAFLDDAAARAKARGYMTAEVLIAGYAWRWAARRLDEDGRKTLETVARKYRGRK